MTQSTTENKAVCLVCGNTNRVGALVCENCGSLLNAAAKTRQATRDLRGKSDKLREEYGQETLEGGNVEVGNEYQVGMSVMLELEDSDTPITVSAEQLREQIVIGRRDPITQQSPAVDLDEYAAYRFGVSRKHAGMQLINGELTVSDLGSSNGTFINGRRLPMRQPQVIVNGDRLKVGQMEMVVHFVANS